MNAWKTSAGVMLFALVAGCASPGRPADAAWTDPGQAVLLAAAQPNAGFTGTFTLTVQGAGRTSDVHLNSQSDYRDPRNLSITILPSTAAELERKLGAPLEEALMGKHILVTGTALRTRVDFLVDGQPSGKYYYQTHVRVANSWQIQVL